MSYLNGARINFWGGGSTNVDTANNEQYQPQLVDLAAASVTSELSDRQIIEFLRSPAERDNQPYYAHGGWNYYGDHQVALMDNQVSSHGQPGAITDSGGLVGQPVYLLGSVDPITGDGPYGGPVMVDLDPTSSITTQIFSGGLQIGGAQPKLLIRGNSTAVSHFLGLRYDSKKTQPPYATPGSAFASGTFQFAFKKEDIVSWDQGDATLQAIIGAPNCRGVVVRINMFQFYPGFSTAHMQQNYADNRNDVNPSLGRIIGSVGPWFEDEPGSIAPGRLLQNTQLGGAQGLAHLDVENKILSLDLVSALEGAKIRQQPHDNSSPIEPNVDYGDLRIGTSEGVVVSTPSLPESYYRFGGVFDIALSDDQIATLSANPLKIGSSRNDLAIEEFPLRIYSEQRNIYANATGSPTPNVELYIKELGSPLRTPVTIAIASQAPGTLPDGKFLSFPASVGVAAGEDRVSVPLGDILGKDGFMSLVFSTANASPYIVSFRKYPEGDIEIPASGAAIPWQTVYEECLRFFYVLFPAMSKRIPLNDKATIQAVGGEILKRISEEYRDTTLYMPLTRSLSPKKIALLKAYLKQSEV